MQTIEKRQGIKIGCPEESAFRRGFLSLTQLETLAHGLPKCEYRDYLFNEVLAEARQRDEASIRLDRNPQSLPA